MNDDTVTLELDRGDAQLLHGILLDQVEEDGLTADERAEYKRIEQIVADEMGYDHDTTPTVEIENA